MPGTVELPEDLIIRLARQRGLALDAERAAILRPLLESLLARLARIADRPGVEPPPDRLGEPGP
jgi:hypothetical protein